MDFNLAHFGVDLTAAARAGRLDPVLGRDAQMDRVIRVLVRKTKNNPVLLGEPGVGKTAIVEGLAQRIAAGDVPVNLQHVTVYALNLGSLLAGTGYRGDFEQRLQDLIAELRRPGKRRLLFVDELHLLGQAGRSEGGIDAGNLLKPLLARGELPCIGASTPDEWSQLISRDPALERRFQPVHVPEPSAEDTVLILRGLRARFEDHHGVEIADEALAAAVAQSIAHTPHRRLPDKAVDLLDEACALLRLSTGSETSPESTEIRAQLTAARDRFDLETFARLQHRTLPKLRSARRPRLDTAAITRALPSDASLAP